MRISDWSSDVCSSDPPALAQETPADVVVTAAGAPQSVNETGDAITVVTRDDLEARQTVSIADYLATTPGISITRSRGPGTLTSLSIRGAEATRSEDRSVGKEGVSTGRSRWSPYH